MLAPKNQADGLRNATISTSNQFKNKKALRCIAIASGKGGVGKTFVSVNTAIALASLGNKVLLIDADLGLANVDILMGKNPEFTLQDAIFHGKSIEEIVCKTDYGVDFLPASSGERQMLNIGSARLNNIVNELLSYAADYDILMFDCGAGINQSVTSFIAAAPQTLVVMTMEPTSIMDAYALMKVAKQDKLSDNINVVLNMVRSDEQGQKIFKNLTQISKNYLCSSMNLLGIIPYSPLVHKAVLSRKPLFAMDDKGEVAQRLKQIALRIMGDHAVSIDEFNTEAILKGIMSI
ncbi:MAG: MinD/ParA family protein [Lentisphaeraceae bacterium]|nr:MinD/ParA family protein [Lentisphaeraceae bacterium]